MYSMRELKFINKKKTNRATTRENHRWTEDETNMLLDNIISAMKTFGIKFEQPTARKFYTEYCTHNMPYVLDWVTKRHKMRHLKTTYIKAKEWKENVGSELFESDKRHISARIKTMCPYYNKLDEIFGPILNSDPIGPIVMDEDSTFDNTSTNNGNDEHFREKTDSLLIPKQEGFSNMDRPEDTEADESEIEMPCYTRHEVSESAPQIYSNETHPNQSKSKNNDMEQRTHPTDIEQLKLYFEKEKFELNYRLETRKLNLEREKLAFEKVKFFETQKLRKYELDKQFEMKKMELQKDERIQRLEFDESTFNHNEN